MFTAKDLKILEEARESYGEKYEVSVAAEECCELAKELLKYNRYDDSDEAIEATRCDVAEELTDVLIIAEHIKMMYGIVSEELEATKNYKIHRLEKRLKERVSNES